MTGAEGGLAEIVRTHARQRGESPAITCGDEVIAWGELDERSNRAASVLASDGIGLGDRIAFIGKNGPEYFDVLFGAAKLGAVVVAVNWRLKPAEMASIVEDASAQLLVYDSEFAPALAEVKDKVSALKRIIVYGGTGTDASDADYSSWLAGGEPTDPGHRGRPQEIGLQLYTSGTTGLPKGAMLTNANLDVLHAMARSMFGLDDQSINLVVLPTFHIGGVGYALGGMAQGGHTILMGDFEPGAVLHAMGAHRITNAFFVPAMLAVMSAVPGAADGDYSSLRSILYGASPVTDETLKAAIATFRCDFLQVYGMTETTGAITQLAAEDHDPDGGRSHLLRSAGKPFDWVELRIVDNDTGEDRPVGEVGELWTRSRQNMSGYWNNPGATVETITAEGWLRTGDAGYIDDSGYLFLTDRVKDMIVTGAENVYPIEVENVLAGHPAVADVAVIGVPDRKWGETVKAIVVLRPGAAVSSAELISFARDRIAHFKCPTSVDYIDVLPRNPSGKILKRELREPYWVGHDRRVS